MSIRYARTWAKFRKIIEADRTSGTDPLTPGELLAVMDGLEANALPAPGKPRVAVFIDGSNLFGALRTFVDHVRYEPAKLCALLTGPDRQLVEWRYYDAPLVETNPAYDGQQRFYAVIRRDPRSHLCLGRTAYNEGNGYQQKGVDVRLALDLVEMAAQDRYDVAVLCSADEDFVPAVEAVQTTHGRTVEIAMPTGAKLYQLEQIAGKVQWISKEMYDQARLAKPTDAQT